MDKFPEIVNISIKENKNGTIVASLTSEDYWSFGTSKPQDLDKEASALGRAVFHNPQILEIMRSKGSYFGGVCSVFCLRSAFKRAGYTTQQYAAEETYNAYTFTLEL